MEEKDTQEIVETTYICKFDENGRRGETHLSVDYTDEQKEKMIADGFVEISEEDWEYYVGNKGMGDNGTGYIRDTKTGKPVSAPPYIPSKAEKIARLEAQYEADKKKLKGYIVDAILSDDAEVVAEIKEEMAEIEAQYQHDREELEGE